MTTLSQALDKLCKCIRYSSTRDVEVTSTTCYADKGVVTVEIEGREFKVTIEPFE